MDPLTEVANPTTLEDPIDKVMLVLVVPQAVDEDEFVPNVSVPLFEEAK